MEPESSLPHLQVPTTCPYPEQDINAHVQNTVFRDVSLDSAADA
jgi:hypothetical protein